MTDNIKVGIIGMGKMGILHTGIFSGLSASEVVAIAEKETLIASSIGQIIHSIKNYKDYTQMLEKEELDLAVITTPIYLHTKMAQACVEHGVNFFVEKPLGTSVENCVNLVDALKKTPVINMVGYCKRFVDPFRKAKEIISSAILGDLIYLNSSMYVSQLFSKGRGWRYNKNESGGGMLIGVASHLIDLLLWFFGDISELSGSVKSYYSDGVEDYAHSYLSFKRGLEGFIDVSWSVRNYRLPEIKIEVQGENGILVFTDDYVKLYLDNTQSGFKEGWTTFYKQDLYNGVELDIGGPEYTREDRYILESIKNCKQTEMDVFEALKTQSIIDAIYQSSSSGCRIEVN